MRKLLILSAVMFAATVNAQEVNTRKMSFVEYTEQVAVPAMCNGGEDEECAQQVREDMALFHKKGRIMNTIGMEYHNMLIVGSVIAQEVFSGVGDDYDFYLGRAFEKGYLGL